MTGGVRYRKLAQEEEDVTDAPVQEAFIPEQFDRLPVKVSHPGSASADLGVCLCMADHTM